MWKAFQSRKVRWVSQVLKLYDFCDQGGFFSPLFFCFSMDDRNVDSDAWNIKRSHFFFTLWLKQHAIFYKQYVLTMYSPSLGFTSHQLYSNFGKATFTFFLYPFFLYPIPSFASPKIFPLVFLLPNVLFTLYHWALEGTLCFMTSPLFKAPGSNRIT